MRFRRITVVLIVAFVLLFVLPVALWFGTAESRRVTVEVQQLVSELEKDDAQNKLIALGPKAYGELRRILLYRADNKWARWYNRLWGHLPPSIRDQLPAPGARRKLQDRLQICLDFAGPVICRAMAGAICDTLESGDPHANIRSANKLNLLRPLLWSIPESRRAGMILSNHLARPIGYHLAGNSYDHGLWLKEPYIVPLLAEWLRNEYTVREAAAGLSLLGGKAAFAVPLLVEVAESGRAKPIAKLPVGRVDSIDERRSAAIHALGKIGVTNAAVIQALNKAGESESDELRSASYLATLRLELPMNRQLQTWAEQWNPIEAEQRYSFPDFIPSDMTPPYAPPQFLEEYEILQALGELGPKAVRAVPLLDRIAKTTRTNVADRVDEFDPRQSDRMRLVAVSALCQIEPNRAAPHLPFVLEHFPQWEARDLLRQWRPLREQIIPPMLEELQNTNRRLDAAFILHGVAPELEKPRRILETALTSDDLETRAIALNWLWMLRQDVAQLLPVACELLKTSDEKALRSALIVLEKMGDAARPAIPELKPLLISKHGAPIRNVAGYLLRRLSPADMPPIVE